MVPVGQNWTISFRCQEFYAKVLYVHSHVYPSIETKVADANVINKNLRKGRFPSKILISNRLQSRMSQNQRLQAKNCWIWVKTPKESHWIEMHSGNQVEKHPISSSIFPDCSYPKEGFRWTSWTASRKCESTYFLNISSEYPFLIWDYEITSLIEVIPPMNSNWARRFHGVNLWFCTPSGSHRKNHSFLHLVGFGFTKRAVNFEIVWSTRRTFCNSKFKGLGCRLWSSGHSKFGMFVLEAPGFLTSFGSFVDICFEAALKASAPNWHVRILICTYFFQLPHGACLTWC